MRKLSLIALATFTTTVFAVTGLTQPRRPATARRPTLRARAAQSEEPPMSERIAQELAPFRWGMSHGEVLDYFRNQIRASYLPRMKNLGQVEQYRLMDERQRELRRLEQNYIVFDGTQANRRWDSSFIGDEYTHGNNESMLLYEDARGNREFFFFINDRLWKRVQARNTNGARIPFEDFATQLEALFGPGRRVMNGSSLQTVQWRDASTTLRLADYTTFFSAFCLIYEETATVAQLPTLRLNAPTKVVRRSAVTLDLSTPNTGAVTSDNAANITDRITGKIRVVENADAGAAAAASAAGARSGGVGVRTGSTDAGTTSGTSPADDPLGLGGLGI
jgi:hypothetical protein